MYEYMYILCVVMSLPHLYLFQAFMHQKHSSNSFSCTCIYTAKCQIPVTALASFLLSIKPRNAGSISPAFWKQ